MNAAQHYTAAEALSARAKEYLDQSDAPGLSDEDRTSLVMKAFYTDAMARTHVHLAQLASDSRSIATAIAEAAGG